MTLAALALGGCQREEPSAYRHGLACSERGDLDGAIVCFDEAIGRDPDSAESHFHRGLAFYSRGRTRIDQGDFDKALLDNDRALFDFRKALTIDPKHAQAAEFQDMARKTPRLYKLLFDADQTIDRATRAIEDDPENAEAYNRRGCAYQNRGDLREDPADYDRAIDDFTRAIRLAPQAAEGHRNRGTVYAIRGQLHHAAADHTAASDQGAAVAEYDRAIDNYSRAIDDFQRARGSAVLSAQTHYTRGDAYQKRGDLDRAIDDYTAAIRLQPAFAQAYDNRALTYDAKGERDKARRDRFEARRLRTSPE